ncbi:MAG: cysteine--tRNA ligase [Alphaproteobacteria bacterium]|nr:cysteine--tRNA ligase [Alphaproteobacteria bacterium]
MTIHLYNTLTRQKEEFTPIDPKKVRIYICGPTVWNYAHIGNGRAAVVFDLLVRVMRHAYGNNHVQYVRNITDIDDKIIDAARQSGEKIDVITEKYARIYNEDMAALGAAAPDHQPRATEYVPQMLKMIDKLIKAGHAYEAEGHVLFNVPSWPEYGKLSRRNRDDMIAGARVEVAPYKKDPADFVLWKPSTPDQPGWDSPYGRGRPGWHLECSAMNEALNGNHFDIHAGGEDLIFPHHENEIAQSTCAHGGEKYVNYWMHNGYLMVEGQKMSKSLGNVVLVHDLVGRAHGEAIRLALLSAHYRQPFDWTEDLLQQSKRTLDRYYGLLRDAGGVKAAAVGAAPSFIAALEDDLNTPKAFAELAVMAKDLSTAKTAEEKARARGIFLAAGKLIGLLQQDPETWFKGATDDESAVIEKKIVELQAARGVKDYKKADEIRDQLKQDYAVSVSVTAAGITWRKES